MEKKKKKKKKIALLLNLKWKCEKKRENHKSYRPEKFINYVHHPSHNQFSYFTKFFPFLPHFNRQCPVQVYMEKFQVQNWISDCRLEM